MRGPRRSFERLPARPVVVAKGSSVVSEGVPVLYFTARFVRVRKATHSASITVNNTECDSPDWQMARLA